MSDNVIDNIIAIFRRDPNRKAFRSIAKPQLSLRDGSMFLLFFVSLTMYITAFLMFFLEQDLARTGVALAVMALSFYGFARLLRSTDYDKGKFL